MDGRNKLILIPPHTSWKYGADCSNTGLSLRKKHQHQNMISSSKVCLLLVLKFVQYFWGVLWGTNLWLLKLYVEPQLPQLLSSTIWTKDFFVQNMWQQCHFKRQQMLGIAPAINTRKYTVIQFYVVWLQTTMWSALTAKVLESWTQLG